MNYLPLTKCWEDGSDITGPVVQEVPRRKESRSHTGNPLRIFVKKLEMEEVPHLFAFPRCTPVSLSFSKELTYPRIFPDISPDPLLEEKSLPKDRAQIDSLEGEVLSPHHIPNRTGTSRKSQEIKYRDGMSRGSGVQSRVSVLSST